MKTTKHFVSITALVMMLCMVCTMFASCFLFGGSSISLDKTEANMFVGDSIKLVATTSDKDAEVEWSTSNENVATVRRGTVSAVGVVPPLLPHPLRTVHRLPVILP